jgi:hypothetical protein
MREEVLVLGGEHGSGNHWRDVLILANPPMFGDHLYQRLAIDVVDVADCRKSNRTNGSRSGRLVAYRNDVIETNPNDMTVMSVMKSRSPAAGFLKRGRAYRTIRVVRAAIARAPASMRPEAAGPFTPPCGRAKQPDKSR